MVFVDKQGRTSRPPTLKNWVITIEGLVTLSKQLFEAGIKTILTRNFNQDPVENFFGSIRSHGCRNTNPTCDGFIAAYKTLIINNLMTKHSIAANCEEDESIGCLTTLKNYFNETPLNLVPTSADDVTEIGASINITYDDAPIIMQCTAYIAGYLLKKTEFVHCSLCKRKLCSDKGNELNRLISIREYGRLYYPSENLVDKLTMIKKLIKQLLVQYCSKNNLTAVLFENLNSNCTLDNLACNLHSNCFKIQIFNYCIGICS